MKIISHYFLTLLLSLLAASGLVRAQAPDNFNPSTRGYFYGLAVQADGKILMGGVSAGSPVPNRITRLYSDGLLDAGFYPNANNRVNSVAIQADGRILLGGQFSLIGAVSRLRIARLNGNGTLDTGFNPSANGTVWSMALQSDGKILVAGDFTSIGGATRNRIARLNEDGTLDTAFNPNASGSVTCIAIQADGKVLVGGSFTTINAVARNRIARLNADGTLDAGFDVNANGTVSSLAVQADGNVLLGGDFSSIGGVTRNRIARLNASGLLDNEFNPNANSTVSSLVLQADGRIIVGGVFTAIGGAERYSLARLNTDGTLDTKFSSNALGGVQGLALRADGSVLFLKSDPWNNGIAGAANNIVATQILTVSGNSQIDWARGGSAPEVEQVTFDTWNGNAWISQGAATRVAGGWRITGLTLPASAWVRARGRTTGGFYNGSSGIIEQIVRYGAGPFSDIAVTLSGNSLTSGTSRADFGEVNWTTSGNTKTFTISNMGTATLTGLAITIDGANAGDFTVTAPSVVSLVPGASTTFNVQFSPQGAGPRGGTLSISSNDCDEFPFMIGCTGTGIHQELNFNPDVHKGAAPSSVGSVAMQADGKILLSGNFDTVSGVTRNGIARLHADGTLDLGFNPNPNESVGGLAVQADGKILIQLGAGAIIGGMTRNHLARLNADGTLDTAFNPNPNGFVQSFALQADGKILLGGDFTTIGTVTRNRIARLNADGTVDTGFNPNADWTVHRVTVQADGKIFVTGNFNAIGGVSRRWLARLNADGTVDTSFSHISPNGSVTAVALQADGKIVVGGIFSTINGGGRNRVARLNADGSLDPGFNPGADDEVRHLAVQADGRILMGGTFRSIGEVPRKGFARLNPDGTLDTGFNPDANGDISCLTLQGDGRILVSGNFTSIGGVARTRIARLPNNISPVRTLSVTGSSQIDWLRGGSTPEVEQVTFDTWNGSAWINQGAASRVTGGWRKTGLSLPAGSWVRARGRTIGGHSGASGMIEQVANYGGAGFPDIVVTVDGSAQTSGIGKIDFGAMAWPSAGTGKIVTITNSGTAALNGLAVALTGVDSTQFAFTAPGATSLAPGASTTFAVQFSPTRTGPSDALLAISSNDLEDTPFHIRLNATQTHQDSGFNASDINDWVRTLAVQADGRILFGGEFTSIGGMVRNRIARLYPDGTLDPGFNPNANSSIYSIVAQPDGRILIGGSFSSIGGVTRNRIARLNADGTVDTGFNPDAGVSSIHGITLQPDGKILIGGSFTSIGGVGRNYIARLNADGTLDAGFNPNSNGQLRSLALQADGKIVIGGDFTSIGGVARNRIARLHADGTLDTGFNPNANSSVFSCALQADGKILVGGEFTNIGVVARSRIARLNADGTVDSGFNPDANSAVQSIALQADGKIVIGGDFTSIGGVARNRIARLHADGTRDGGFNPGAGGGGGIQCLALQADGGILAGGAFIWIGGVARSRIARLPNNTAAAQNLAVTGSSQIDWTRGGSAPEVEQVTFETWNGSAWISQGAVTRVSGGWRKTGLSLPASTWVRARGRTTGGYYSSSSGVVEQIIRYGGSTFPRISVTVDGSARTSGTSRVDFGTVDWTTSGPPKTFSVTNTGTATLSGLAVAMSGANAAEFSFTAPAATSLAPGASTTFTVRFTPQGAGLRGATLSISSSAADSSPFTIGCIGTGIHQDPAFNPGAGFTVSCVAAQTDGRILVGGSFTSMGGQLRNRIARLNVDGSIDTGFNPDANNSVSSLAVQADGKILIGGGFGMMSGVARSRIARLNADGTLDAGFNPSASSDVSSIGVQGDGKILIGGYFTSIGGVIRNYIARLNADGTLDSTFNPSASLFVSAIAIQPDGKVLIGGDFTSVGGVARNYLARLNVDGTLDSGFNPSPNGVVRSFALQSDGKILLGGGFTAIGGMARSRIARLNADGTGDTSFNSSADSVPLSIVLQADGKILIGGPFTAIGAVSRNYIARLNADGTLDAGFDPNANGSVEGLALQADGKILAVGGFTTIGSVARNRIARLPNNIAPTQALSVAAGSQIDWLRGGGAPEVEQVTFDTWNGSAWISQGAATRVAGGWRRTGLSLPASTWVRARGRIIGGYYNGSSGIIEQVATVGSGFPSIVVEAPGGNSLSSGVSTVDFGSASVGVLSSRTFTIRNAGTVNLSGIAIAKDGEAAADFIVNSPQQTTLAPGSSTTFTVNYMPSGLGAAKAVLRIASNDAGKSPFEIKLNGYFIPRIVVGQDTGSGFASNSTYNFGSTPSGSTIPGAFSIRNTGLGTLNLGPITMTGANPADFQLITTGTAASIGRSGQTSFLVVFNPSSGGTKTAVLTIPNDDPAGNPFVLNLTGTVNAPPTNITLSTASVAENVPVNTTVGTLSSTDPNAGNTFTYSLVSGTGSTDNASFNISGSSLRIGVSPNFEAKNSYSIRIRTTDQGGLFFEKAFTVTITNVNEAPVIQLPASPLIAEATSASGAVVTYSVTGSDPEQGTINGSGVPASGSVFPLGDTTVNATVTDSGSLSASGSFVVRVVDTTAPVVVAPANVTVEATSNAGAVVNYPAAIATDAVGVTSLTYSQNSGTLFPIGTTPVTITAKDAANNTGTGSLTVTVTPKPASPPTVVSPTSTAISASSAVLGGDVTADGEAAISERGVIYSMTTANNNPLIGGSGVTKLSAPGTTGSFTVNATGLAGGTDYSFKAYATNSAGTSYTPVASFTTLSADADLSDLVLSSGTLSPVFASGTTSYTSQVPNTTTSVTVTPTAANSFGTIQVNGVAVASGTASGPISLNVGSNVISTVVTAQNGTTRTYTVTVSRAAALPTVTSPTSTGITINSATLGGNVSADGGAAISERGVVYAVTATNANPLIGGTGVTKVAGTGTTGVFTVAASGLAGGTAYSFKAYATNSVGTSYSTVAAFSTLVPNSEPNDIILNTSTLAENNAAGATIATLGAVDPDAGNTHTFELVAGDGSTDNAHFAVTGNALTLSVAADFETKASYALRLRATDQGGLFVEKAFTLSVTDQNEAPTDLTLSTTSFAENNAPVATIATLAAVDPDAGNTHYFELVVGAGSDDNTLFVLNGNALTLLDPADFETKASYALRLRATDQNGLFIEKAFTLSVTDQNEAPTDLTLSATDFAENNAPGAAIATLAAVDPDVGNTHTFELVAGDGSRDNALFTVEGNALKISVAADFEDIADYVLRLRATDQNGLFFEKVITLFVTNVNEGSTDATLVGLLLSEGGVSFRSDVISYESVVATTTDSILITPYASVTSATVTVNNNSPVVPVPLVVGPNTVSIRVTAEDGVTTQTYTLVVIRQTNFAAWAATHGGTDPLADPDGDGFNTLIEYAFGLNPQVPGTSSNLPRSETIAVGENKTVLRIVFTRPKVAGGLSYDVEFSNDPGMSSVSTAGAYLTVDNGDGTETVVVHDIPPFDSSSPARFGRVRIVKAE
jgi:uncharacterized delta-60 repeat protein